ncbi:MAG: hypothetical protein HND59_07600 [Pseudomonadota bacterium]|nr:MAG: hypothetical protein HND59_07600 [Pseudomonadota bacterium]
MFFSAVEGPGLVSILLNTGGDHLADETERVEPHAEPAPWQTRRMIPTLGHTRYVVPV